MIGFGYDCDRALYELDLSVIGRWYDWDRVGAKLWHKWGRTGMGLVYERDKRCTRLVSDCERIVIGL